MGEANPMDSKIGRTMGKCFMLRMEVSSTRKEVKWEEGKDEGEEEEEGEDEEEEEEGGEDEEEQEEEEEEEEKEKEKEKKRKRIEMTEGKSPHHHFMHAS